LKTLASDGSIKDVRESLDLSLLTHDSKLHSGPRPFLSTGEESSFESGFLLFLEAQMKKIEAGHAFDFDKQEISISVF